MAEQPLSGVWIPGGTGEQERRVVSPEILDFDKYGAVYGRFLLASIAKTEKEAANIIDPDNINVEFNNLTEDTLRERNYNLVGEKSSLAERKKQWGDTEFSQAYSQWRTEFTRFMNNNIEANSKREQALGIIMSDPKTKAAEFTRENADTLFKEFCEGKSDINTFIERVKINLRSRGKIDPTDLRGLLPELEWIASGLFGKDTASKVVTRLIELESAMHNDPDQVMELFNSNKGRINTLTDGEKETLGLLHDSFPVPQESKTVTIEPTPQSAPVTPEPDKSEPDKDEDKPPSPPIGNLPEQETDKEKFERMNRFQDTVIARELASFQGHIGETARPPLGQTIHSRENSVSFEGKPADLPNFLNEHLKASGEDHATFIFSPNQLKEYITSLTEGFHIEGGNIIVGKDNQIEINNLRITKFGVGVSLDLVLSNDENGIAAEITKFQRDFRARVNKASSRAEVERQIKNINAAIKKRLDEETSKDNSVWKTKKVSILEGKVLVEFEKTPPTS